MAWKMWQKMYKGCTHNSRVSLFVAILVCAEALDGTTAVDLLLVSGVGLLPDDMQAGRRDEPEIGTGI